MATSRDLTEIDHEIIEAAVQTVFMGPPATFATRGAKLRALVQRGSLSKKQRVLNRLCARDLLLKFGEVWDGDYYNLTPRGALASSYGDVVVEVLAAAFDLMRQLAETRPDFESFAYRDLMPPPGTVSERSVDAVFNIFEFTEARDQGQKGLNWRRPKDVEKLVALRDADAFIAWLIARSKNVRGLPRGQPREPLEFGAVAMFITGNRLKFLKALVEAAERRTDTSVQPDGVAEAAGIPADELAELENFLTDKELLEGQTDEYVGVTRLAIDLVEEIERRETRAKEPVAPTGGAEVGAKTKPTRLFVSHSSADVALARALVELLEATFNVPRKAILCTSVPNYKLTPGDDVPGTLRAHLQAADVVVGLITRASLAAKWVLLELGAAWAFEKRTCPLLAPGVDFSDLPGHFKDVHASSASSATDVHELLDLIESACGMPRKESSGARVHEKLDEFIRAAEETGAGG